MSHQKKSYKNIREEKGGLKMKNYWKRRKAIGEDKKIDDFLQLTQLMQGQFKFEFLFEYDSFKLT